MCKKTVKQLDMLSEGVKKIEIKYQQKLDGLEEELRKSILQKAFSGELTKELAVA